MYPTLTDLLRDLFGVAPPLPIQTFGLMLGISFALAAWTLYLELVRKEKQGLIHPVLVTETIGLPASAWELITSGLAGFIIGYKLVYIISEYSNFVDDTQGILLSAVGSLPGGIAGAAAFIYKTYSDKEKKRLEQPETITKEVYPHDMVSSITMIAAFAGIIGAKVFHNLENLDEFERDPVNALLSFSGLTMYGGLICGAGAVLWFARKNKISLLQLCDATLPGVMLAYGTGRIGCQLAGDGDWGIVNLNLKPDWLSWLPDWAWAYNYPRNVISEGIPIPGCEGKHCMMLPDAVYPTPLYEAVVCIALFFVLWSLRKRINTPGLLSSIYFLLNGVERFFIEKIRVNTKYHVAGHSFTQAELISTILILLGLSGIYYFTRKKKVHV